jgi:hypothetical protein
MHEGKRVDACFRDVADWQERLVVFQEATELWLNNQVLSDIESL